MRAEPQSKQGGMGLKSTGKGPRHGGEAVTNRRRKAEKNEKKKKKDVVHKSKMPLPASLETLREGLSTCTSGAGAGADAEGTPACGCGPGR